MNRLQPHEMGPTRVLRAAPAMVGSQGPENKEPVTKRGGEPSGEASSNDQLNTWTPKHETMVGKAKAG
jgi:hypothetical protein